MNQNLPEKNHDTVLRILELLKILLNEDLTRDEIINRLKTVKDIDNVNTHEACLKYFNTLQLLGFKFDKLRYKYKLKNALISVDLTLEEKKVFKKLLKTVLELHNKKTEDVFKNTVFKLDKYFNSNFQLYLDEILNKEYNTHNYEIKNNLINTLRDILYNEEQVNITYKKSNNTIEKILVEIKDITSTHIVCYNTSMARNKKIAFSSILSIQHSPKKIPQISVMNSVVFDLYGRLANSYKTKKSEQVLNFEHNHISVSNTEEDKDILLLRLLKYGENCKINRPAYMKDDILKLTDEMLKNLGA